MLEAGESIVRTPAFIMRADVAAAIMSYGMIEGWFTGKKLADYFHGTASDWADARRIINGTNHAADVAALAEHFFAALKGALVFTANASQIAEHSGAARRRLRDPGALALADQPRLNVVQPKTSAGLITILRTAALALSF